MNPPKHFSASKSLAAFKYVYRNVHVRAQSLEMPALKFAVQSWFEFVSLEEAVVGRWELVRDGVVLDGGELPNLSLGFREEAEFELNVPPPGSPPAGAEYWINLVYELPEDTFFAEKGFVVAFEQFMLPVSVPEKLPENTGMMTVDETLLSYRISGDDFAMEFSKRQGTITDYIFRGTALVDSGLKPDFWRPPTDNDRGNLVPTRFRMWKDAGEEWEVHGISLVDDREGVVLLRTNATISWRPFQIGEKNILGSFVVDWLIYGNGVLEVKTQYQRLSNDPGLLRFGMRFALLDDFEEMTWLGRGPESTMPDRDYEPLGLFSTTVTEDFHPFSKPQETGNKQDVRWIEFVNGNGVGLRAEGQPLLSASANRYPRGEINGNERNGNDYWWQIERDQRVWVNLDLGQRGVGGDTSWPGVPNGGARPKPEYLLPNQDYEFSFKLRPFAL